MTHLMQAPLGRVLTAAFWSLRAVSAQGQVVQSASDDGVWRPLPAANPAHMAAARAADDSEKVARFVPRTYRLVQLQAAPLQEALRRAPVARIAPANAPEVRPATITLPLPSGGFETFRIERSDLVPAALSDDLDGVQAYRGSSLTDRSRTVSVVTGPAGVHAQILTDTGTIIIDPFAVGGVHATFEKAASRSAPVRFNCLVKSDAAAAARPAGRTPIVSGTNLRTYRLAVACTGEYAVARGGTKPLVGQAIAATVARVSQIYERELAIRLQLVPNNGVLIFLNAGTDPFTGNNDADTLIDESQTEIDTKIGNTNYDIGHTFSTGAGGLAGLGVVCRSGQKARGVTGSSSPLGDPFDVDYVAHEMGHQFGGNHTFNGTGGSCSGSNRNGGTAYEPGSGSTIQAYAGICSPNDLQPNSDDYFHAVSLDEMIEYSSTGAGNAVPTVPTGNTPPAVDAGQDFTIPKSTPFTLTARGFDADGDPLTYCWEQFDLGPALGLTGADDGAAPLFRSLRPSPNPSRTLPQLATVLSGTPSTSEKLPELNRTMRFRVTVRDNRMGGGGIGGDEVTVKVHASAGPFQVNAPTGGATAGMTEVKWSVAKTNLAPISTQFVNISLSVDDGLTFSPLAANTPNDGAEMVALPNASVSSARIKVSAVDNVFFAVSPRFPLQAARASVVVVRHAEQGAADELTGTGKQRALALQQLLTNAGISEIHSAKSQRARQTAQPLAAATGLSIQEFENEQELANSLAGAIDGRRALVVAQSEWITPLLTELGVSSPPAPNNEFDNLYVAVITDDGSRQLRQAKYSATPLDSPISTTPLAKLAPRSDSSEEGRKLENIERLLKEIQQQVQELKASR